MDLISWIGKMPYQYKKHYTRDEARRLLPQVRKWLSRIAELRDDLRRQDAKLESLMEPGRDTGGPAINRWVRTLVQIKEACFEFERREIQIKDLDRGLIDFPALIGGKEVFLCWEQDEEDIEFWHELDAGYAGREKLKGSD